MPGMEQRADLDDDMAALAPLPRLDSAAALAFGRRGAATCLRRLHQDGQARILFPRPAAGDVIEAVLLNTAGGMTDGDRLRLDIRAEDGAAARITSQAAERIYRGRRAGRPSRITTRLTLAADAWLEWLPQETILFDGGRLQRRLTIDLAANARLLAAEALVFGRRASGEEVEEGFLHESWRLRREGRLVWADGLRLVGPIARLLDRRGLGSGARAVASVVFVAQDAADWLGRARHWLAEAGGRASASARDGLLLARFLAADGFTLRRDLGAFVTALRAAVAGLPPCLPRVWAC